MANEGHKHHSYFFTIIMVIIIKIKYEQINFLKFVAYLLTDVFEKVGMVVMLG